VIEDGQQLMAADGSLPDQAPSLEEVEMLIMQTGNNPTGMNHRMLPHTMTTETSEELDQPTAVGGGFQDSNHNNNMYQTS
jgi:hypothetical protein